MPLSLPLFCSVQQPLCPLSLAISFYVILTQLFSMLDFQFDSATQRWAVAHSQTEILDASTVHDPGSLKTASP